MAEAAVAEKPKVAGKSMGDLLAHLRETGTSNWRVEAIETFLRDYEEDPSPGDLIDWLRQNNMPQGTIDKVGKFLVGEQYVANPESVASDETTALRQENATFKEQLREKNIELSRLRKLVPADASAAREQERGGKANVTKALESLKASARSDKPGVSHT